jgi:cytochrome c oxidase subunit 4
MTAAGKPGSKEKIMTEYHDPSNVVNPEHSDHHIVTPVTYAIVFVSLLVGTAITVVAAYIDLGIFNPVVALAIACTKAVIVILFFMHVKYQSKLIKLTVGAGFFTFLVLITMTLSDYISRAWGLWS